MTSPTTLPVEELPDIEPEWRIVLDDNDNEAADTDMNFLLGDIK